MGERESFLPPPLHHMVDEGWGQIYHTLSWGADYLCPVNGANSTVLPGCRACSFQCYNQCGAGLALLLLRPQDFSEGQVQLSCS